MRTNKKTYKLDNGLKVLTYNTIEKYPASGNEREFLNIKIFDGKYNIYSAERMIKENGQEVNEKWM